jgi:DmsE family decaheme c-type cytochrome
MCSIHRVSSILQSRSPRHASVATLPRRPQHMRWPIRIPLERAARFVMARTQHSRSTKSMLSIRTIIALLGLGIAAIPTKAQTAEYVGSDACQACHEDIHAAFQKDPHAVVDVDKKRGWATHACESCHGPASKHVESASAEDIRNPAKLGAAKADETCLTCHLNQPTHVGRIQSGHARSRVSCLSCHRMHKPESESLVVRKAASVNKQCSSCHLSSWSQFQRPHAHRLVQGAMSCTDCHNPHGSFFLRQVRTFAANEPGCFKCHSDKRGPFTFEHAPMRLEGCSSCHEVHGSANPRMLTRQEVRYVCLECHSNMPAQTTTTPQPVIGVVPPSFHDLRSPRFRNCTICHQKIHGSHVDRNLTR